MYKCDSCGAIFDEPDSIKYLLCRIDGTQYYDNDQVCPFCQSDGFGWVEECDRCGEYFHEDELTFTDDGVVCYDCSGVEALL